MNSGYKNKLLINLGFIVLGLLAIVFFIVYPAMKEIINTSQAIKEERIKLERKQALGLNLQKTQQELTEIKDQFIQLNQIFIKKGEELNFVALLEGLADKNQITFNLESDFVGNKIDGNIEETQIKINLGGDFSNFLNFLQATEKLIYYYNPGLIMISQKKLANDKPLTIQLMGKTYLISQ